MGDDLFLLAWRVSFGRNGLREQARDVELVADYFIEFQRLIVRMLELQGNRLAQAESPRQDDGE